MIRFDTKIFDNEPNINMQMNGASQQKPNSSTDDGNQITNP